MAENLLVLESPGGTPVGADEITINGVLQKVQYVKILDATDNSIERIPGTAARGMLVELGGIGASIRSRSVNVTIGGGSLSVLSGLAALANRKNILMINTGTQRIFLGSASGAAAVVPLDPGVPFSIDWASAIDPYLISSSGTQALAILETA